MYLSLTIVPKCIGPGYSLMTDIGTHSTKQTLRLLYDAAPVGVNYLLDSPLVYFGELVRIL